jgi:hypothetical protein
MPPGSLLIVPISRSCMCCNPSVYITTNALWYIGNRQIQEVLGVQFFANHIRALTENSDSKSADAGNPFVQQHGRNLCPSRSVWSHPQLIKGDWSSVGQLRLTVIRWSSWHAGKYQTLFSYPDGGFLLFYSVIR